MREYLTKSSVTLSGKPRGRKMETRPSLSQTWRAGRREPVLGGMLRLKGKREIWAPMFVDRATLDESETIRWISMHCVR